MATSRLIVKVAQSTGVNVIGESRVDTSTTAVSRNLTTNGPLEVAIHTQVMTKFDNGQDSERHGTFFECPLLC